MSGVKNKIQDMSSAFANSGCEFIVINSEVSGRVGNITYINVEDYYTRCGGWVLKNFKYYFLMKAGIFNKYDLIILRYSMFDFSSLFLSKKIRGKIIFEHHTKLLNEIKYYNMNWLVKHALYLCEKFLSPVFFSGVHGNIGVTHDIVLSEASRLRAQNLPMFVFSNGISFNGEIKLRNICREKCVLSFVASSFSDWHGLDRLANAILEYDGHKHVVINIVGVVSHDVKQCLQQASCDNSVSIIFWGVVNRSEVENILSNSHAAFDSLGLDRLGMSESSTLKSKHYAVTGTPIISSTPDPDLLEHDGFFYEASIVDNSFSLGDIVHWVDRIDYSKAFLSGLRYKEFLSWNKKVEMLLSHVEKSIK